MRTVQDIVNNGLNQLQLLRFDAEGHVPPESLTLFDDAIRDTVTRLTALGDLRRMRKSKSSSGQVWTPRRRRESQREDRLQRRHHCCRLTAAA
jgi:hypothetical protein